MTGPCGVDSPADPARLLGEARRCLAEGAIPAARALADAALAANPQDLDARLIANQTAFMAGDLVAAMHHVERGEADHPDCADFALRRARCLLAWNQVAAARTALADAEAKLHACRADQPQAGLWGMIGDAHTLLNAFDRALAAYDRAIAGEPGAMTHHFNRAVVARYLGDTAAAIAGFETVVAHDRFHAEAWLNLVHLVHQSAGANLIVPIAAALAQVPERPDTVRTRIHFHYALAKCHEDIGDGLASFVQLDAGARLMRAAMRYDVREDLALIDLLRRNDLAEVPVKGGFRGVRPIFVLGLPRSGSTLVERILTSHSQVGSIGESPAFGQALADVARAAGIDPGDGKALIRAAMSFDPAAIGQRYAELTAPWRGAEPYFVDKLPDNHLHVALIRRALPEARIVHTTRDPLGNLYGLYKTLFNRACPYSYDLDDLVAYYGAYRALMEHWRALPGPAMIAVSHEALVERPEPVIRALIADCGLDWQPACLAFHENPQPTTTQSAAQVRRPLNREGVDAWRRFAPLLAPLRQRLEARGLLDG